MFLKNSTLRVLFVSIFTFSALFSAPIGSASEKKERSHESSCKEKNGGENYRSSMGSLSVTDSKSKSKQRSSREEDQSKDKKCKNEKDGNGNKDEKDEDVKDGIEEVYVKTPGAVSNLLVATCSANVALTWNAPTKPRSIPVSNYTIRYSSDSGVNWILHPVTTTQTTITLNSLTPGLTYIFQVAAQNIYGLGVWSVFSASCVIPNPNNNAFSFVISGLENISGTGLNYSIDGTTPEEVFIVQVNGPQSGSLMKGLYTHDLYLSLPAGTGSTYSFSVNGTPITSAGYVFFPQAASMGVGHPVITTENLFFYDFAETYAFNITSGNSITIAITTVSIP
jgi:hypothetical protein